MSSLNLESALGTFYEEAGEMLAQIEQSILKLEDDPRDVEELNALFRGAHTIKGSAGLFGLDEVVAFTHHVETLLDQLREGKLLLNAAMSSLLFLCRDHIQLLLDRASQQAPATPAQQAQEQTLLAQLGALIDGHASAPGQPEASATLANSLAAPPGAVNAAPSSINGTPCWQITARFGPDTYRNGFDPLAILSYLEAMGDVSNLALSLMPDPGWDSIDPETCHLALTLQLHTARDEAGIRSAFMFVQDDCDLQICAHAPACLPPHAQAQPQADTAGAPAAASLPAPAASPVQAVPTAPGAPTGAVEPTAPDAARNSPRDTDKRHDEQRMVRIPATKLDQLINLVGELVIAGSGANTLARKHKIAELVGCTRQLNSLVEAVRDSALSMRMVPIGETFSRFRRVVRDVCASLGKSVELELLGTEAELDKSMVERLVDPLMHIVRNALDHGIEGPQERVAAGKSEQGRLVLSAFHDAGSVVIQIVDDGRGLARERILAKAVERGLVAAGASLSDADIFALVFAPGFSTAEAVTNLSGRGVGMDVVKRNIEELRGSVKLYSEPGAGTTVEIRLPLTLAIIDGFHVRVGRSQLVIPLDEVVECINTRQVTRPSDGSATGHMPLRGAALPIVHLRQLFGIEGPCSDRQSIVVVRHADQQVGLVLDALAGEQQTVIKPLGPMFQHLKGISGSTILGSGEVALILDVAALVALAENKESQGIHHADQAMAA